ncbi:hypothetical protein AVEN_105864-1 [Araneus ventricosus]|uniref:Uncharacterized protein n=1 Tax=Araneus ventricosus TaxID=182803 RepID=A0A4Y2VQF7_ARAVE|nr:hypothetical protein AVEN_105864-1 [Araneus ventricosus]
MSAHSIFEYQCPDNSPHTKSKFFANSAYYSSESLLFKQSDVERGDLSNPTTRENSKKRNSAKNSKHSKISIPISAPTTSKRSKNFNLPRIIMKCNNQKICQELKALETKHSHFSSYYQQTLEKLQSPLNHHEMQQSQLITELKGLQSVIENITCEKK